MKTNNWKKIKIKNLRLRIVRENLRMILVMAVKAEIDRLDHLEDIYKQNRQISSHWEKELLVYNQKESLIESWSRSILRCSEGFTCKSLEVRPLNQDMSSLDKDMVWNPLLKHWICIDCYNFYYKSRSAKLELENFLRKKNLL